MTSIFRFAGFSAFLFFLAVGVFAQNTPRSIGGPTTQRPQPVAGGFDLPNGWRITPAGKSIADTEDMVLKMVVAPDGRAVIRLVQISF